MNRCRMTLRILITLFAVTALLTSVAVAKTQTVNTTKTLQGNVPGQPNLVLKQQENGGNPVIVVGGDEVRYQDESAKSSIKPQEAQELKYSPASSFLSEDFEVIVPPTGWSEIISNASYNWKKQTVGTAYSGTGAADVEYDPSLAAQDEWLVSPAMNFATATSLLKVEFHWNMSYYWGVSPFDNYDLELWISTDGGGTWPTKLWDETGEGVFTNFTWYGESVDLSGYVGQTNVKLAFRYVGADGAQAVLDLVSVNDDSVPIGRCCYGTSCADVTAAACTGLGGLWTAGLNCTANPCPVGPANDFCASAIAIGDVVGLAFNPTGATLDGPGGFISNRNIWYLYTASCTGTATVSLCASSYDTRVRVWPNETCPSSGTGLATDDDACAGPGSGLASIVSFPCVSGSKYLIEVAPYSASTTIGTGLMTVSCAAPSPGDNCTLPYDITLGTASLPYTLSGQTTCGRVNDYSNTCMGSYDGGEDMVIRLVLTDAVLMDITLNPLGTSYTGFAIDNVCPLDIATGSCLGYISSSGTAAYTLYGLNLPAGTYYIMVDTWPSPNCIPSFNMTFAGAAPPPPNDNCASATPVGDVLNLPFDNAPASHDGSGTCSTTGKNLWYCFTAPITGNARISLCGSSFDTKLAVYDGCSCAPLGTQLACEDDNCGLQSEAIVPVIGGNQYKVEVTGYSATSVGSGFLTIETTVPPPNDECTAVTPVVLTPSVPVTFTGDNTNASPDCASFPGPNVWEAFTLTACSDVTLDYCGTSPAFGNAWLNLANGCPCVSFTTGAAFDVSTCGDGNVTMTWLALPAGTYYYPVMNDPDNGAVGPYTIHVVSEPVVAYCAADGFCDEYISRVQLGSIDNSSSCGSSYSDYTAISTKLVRTAPFPITVTNGLAYTGDQCGVWIDWDQNFCFDASEQVTMSGGPTSYTGTVTPPAGAVLGPTRMRVRIVYTGALPPCGTTSYGETEDYTIDVKPFQPTAYITPDPQYQYYQFAVPPITNTFHFGMFNGGYTANDVNLSTVKVNALFPVTSAVVLPSYPGFAGPVVKAELPSVTFLTWWFYVNNYLYDVNNANFAVMGQFNDATNFSIIGDVVIIGKNSPAPATFIVPPGVVLLPGDFNTDGMVSVSDPVAVINYIFAGGSAPANPLIGDANCSGLVSISDAVYMIQYIFGGGAAPCASH